MHIDTICDSGFVLSLLLFLLSLKLNRVHLVSRVSTFKSSFASQIVVNFIWSYDSYTRRARPFIAVDYRSTDDLNIFLFLHHLDT